MIDIESEIYAPIAKELTERFPGILVTGNPWNASPKQFPCAYIAETGNMSSRARIDSSGAEKYSILTWRADVWSNKAGGNRAECKKIMSVIDEMLFALNFTRLDAGISGTAIGNGNVFLMSARYNAETDGKYLYRYRSK